MATKTKEQIEQELVDAANKRAQKEIALAKKKAEELFEEQQEELKERQEVEKFLMTFPALTSRKWWTGFDEGVQIDEICKVEDCKNLDDQ